MGLFIHDSVYWPMNKLLAILFVLIFTGPLPAFGEQNTDLNQPETELTEDPNRIETGAIEAGTIETATIESDREITPPVDGGKKPKKTKDPNRGRILPIPIFITEPAVGDGLGLALTYFHRKKDTPEGVTIASPDSIGEASREQAPPPTVTGVLGAYTSNETVAAAVGHMNSFKDDHIRFTGVVAWADVNSTFYLQDQPIKFNVGGTLIYQETRFRFGDSRWFWGIGLSYLDATAALKVELPEDPPIDSFIDLFRRDLKNSGLSAKLAWDTRDNTSMPNKGQLFDLAVWRYDDAIGSDFDYWDTRLKLLSFHPINEKFVLGLRLEYSIVDGSAPFFSYPYVKLRGIPALRYQGESAAVAEIEGRYNFSSKWALIGFAGTGKVNSDIPIFDTEQSIYSYGLGGRYKIFDAQNVWVGIDIARGPEEFNWYIQVGHAW